MSRSSRRSPLRQSLSFHRLRDASVARRIVASTGLAPPALVYEFGAGDGVLTAELARRAGHVVAIELDRTLHGRLAKRMAPLPTVRTVHADFREMPLPIEGRYSIVANLPFSLTAETLRRITTAPNPPEESFLIVQREAAATWTGSSRSTVAATLAGLRFSFEVPLALRRRDFSPWPRVESVLLAVRRRPVPLLAPAESRQFASFVRHGFGGGRPTLERNLAGRTDARTLRSALNQAGIEPGAAPSSLGFGQWLLLWSELCHQPGSAGTHPGSMHSPSRRKALSAGGANDQPPLRSKRERGRRG